MKWFQAVNQQSSYQCRSGRQLIDLLSKRILIFTTTSGKRSWERELDGTVMRERKYSTASRVVEGHCNTECWWTLVFIWSSGASLSFCAVFFHSVTQACTKKNGSSWNQTAILQRNFHGTALQTSTSHRACKLQVTPPSRGRYQNKGPCEAELSAGSGPHAAEARAPPRQSL